MTQALISFRANHRAKSEYEIYQHIPMAEVAGCSKEQIEAILDRGTEVGYFESAEAKYIFKEKELVLLGWIRKVAFAPEVDDETMAAVKKVSFCGVFVIDEKN